MAKSLLTDRTIRNAKPKAKPYRLFDGEGLALRVSPTGTKSWQLRHRHAGKPQTATLGKFTPLQGLDWARKRADEQRELAAQGEHLTSVKRVMRAAKAAATQQTFKTMAAAWLESEGRRKKWSADYVDEVEQSLRNHLSKLDPLPVAKIVASITAPIMHGVERAAPGMAERVARRLNAIMDYAVEQGALVQNPLPRRRAAKAERRHFAAVTTLPGIGKVLRTFDALPDPNESARRAHLLLVFTVQRVAEVVGAKWDEFDLVAGTWAIPRARMKRKDADRGPHVVPLPPRLLALLREWRKADGEGTVYVCPTVRDAAKPMLPEGVAKVYRNDLGLTGTHSPHSWRSAFSTVCREAGKDGDTIEAQLDHVVGNSVTAAYDRAQGLELRRALMAWYEATLMAARDGADVVPFQRAS